MGEAVNNNFFDNHEGGDFLQVQPSVVEESPAFSKMYLGAGCFAECTVVAGMQQVVIC